MSKKTAKRTIRRTEAKTFSLQKRIVQKITEMELSGYSRSDVGNLAFGEFFAKDDHEFGKWFESWKVYSTEE